MKHCVLRFGELETDLRKFTHFHLRMLQKNLRWRLEIHCCWKMGVKPSMTWNPWAWNILEAEPVDLEPSIIMYFIMTMSYSEHQSFTVFAM